MARKKYTEVELSTMREISKNLRRITHYKGLSQKEVCELTGLSSSTISDYFNAVTLISMGNLHKIAEALKVPNDEIYPIDVSGNVKNPNSSIQEKELEPFAIFDLVDKFTDDEIINKYYKDGQTVGVNESIIRQYLSHARYLKSQNK